ncbi:hypothetical protein [Paenibacillus sp. GYB003]|uniref:hypothetical protein n=1 Tax=Paenibacillus sp. GYB003 TaxID=2994392 RepID=UPI002F96715D
MTRRSLLASLGAAGAALAAGAAFRLTTGDAAAGASVIESAYAPQPGATSPEACAYPQVDFVKLLQSHNETAATLYAKVTGERALDVLIPFKGKRCAHYSFAKDPNDDFVKFLGGSVSILDTVYAQTGALDYETKTGTWVTGFPPNEYTTQVGAAFSFSFEGTGFDFQHYADTRGGVWEFKVDGAASGTVSTHIDAVPTGQLSGNVAKRPIARGLTNGSHTVVATFKGDDPNHAPSSGAGTSRGWVRNAANYSNKADTFRTAIVYGDDRQMGAIKLFDALHSWSNKEFALNVAPAGSGYPAHWLPEHVNVGTVYAVSQRVYFDDAEITDWTPDASVRPVRSVKIVQHLIGKHPSDPGNPVAEIYCVHTASPGGVAVKSKIKWLRAVTISAGYGMMFPVFGSFARKFATSFGNLYDATAADGSTTDLGENDQAASYAYVHDGTGSNGEPDTVVAMTVHDIAKTFRHGQPGRRSSGSIVWLQHRDAAMQKLYPQVYDKYTAAAGDTYEAGGVYFIGELPLACRFYG